VYPRFLGIWVQARIHCIYGKNLFREDSRACFSGNEKVTDHEAKEECDILKSTTPSFLKGAGRIAVGIF
jgi:hypothetical protein